MPSATGVVYVFLSVAGPTKTLSSSSANWITIGNPPFVDIRTFGADPTGAADSTTAINNAILSVCTAGGRVFIPRGTFKTSAPLAMNACTGLDIAGTGAGSIISSSITTNAILSVFGAGANNSIHDVNIQGAGGASITCIYVHSSSNTLIQDSVISGCGKEIWMDANTQILHVIHNQIIGIPANGIGILQGGYLTSDLIIERNLIQSNSAGSQALAGIYITGSSGTKITNNDLFADGIGLYINTAGSQLGQYIESTQNWYDSCSTAGLEITGDSTGSTYNFQSVNDDFSSNQIGIVTSSTGGIDGLMFTNCQVIQSVQWGIYHGGGTNVEFHNCQVAGNSTGSSGTYQGMAVASNISKWKVIGGVYGAIKTPANLTATPTQGYGIFLNGGTTDYYEIIGATVLGNVTGGIGGVPVGVHAVVENNLGFNTAPVNFIATETGANNAIAGTSILGLVNGTCVSIQLAHTLQAGGNSFNLNALGTVAIKSHLNPANNIATGYANSGSIWPIVNLCYVFASGGLWLDMAQ